MVITPPGVRAFARLRPVSRAAFAALAALLLASVRLPAATPLADAFADGDRTTQNPPASAAWFGSSSGSPLTVAANALAQPPATSSVAYFTAAGAPRVLAVGDAIEATFTLKLSGSAPLPASNDFLRVCLLNSHGTATDRNATASASRIAADVFNTGTTAFANNSGYMGTASINPASAAGLKLYAHNFGATGGVTGTGSYAQLGAIGGAGACGFAPGAAYAGSLKVERTAAAATVVTLAFAGAFGGGTGNTWSFTRTDTTTATYVFDLLAFYVSGGANFAGLTLDDVTLAHAGVPVVTSASSASAGQGTLFNAYQIVATETPSAYGATGLPPGLAVDPATGLIEGRPSAAGTYNATVTATNARGTGSAPLAVTVAAAPAPIATIAAFKAALGAAAPGSVIVLADGVYSNFGYQKLTKGGSSGQPVTIRAQTPGGVTFNGDFQLEFATSFVVVDGFRVSGDPTPSPDYAYPAASSGLFKVYGADNRVTGCSVSGFNRVVGPTKWVQIKGERNRVDHCHFANKTGQGQMLEVVLDGTADNHRVDHNVFRDFAYGNGANEYETVRVGSGALSIGVASASTVEKNYFEACDGEIETISVKSSDCVIRDNTLVNCRGTITLRQGRRNLVTGNVLLNLAGKAESGGIRVCNRDHVIRDNYVHGARTSGSDHIGGVSITASDVDPAADPATYAYDKHWPVQDVVVQGNSLINCKQSFIHGGGYAYNPVSATFIDNCARNNLGGDGRFDIVRLIRPISTAAYSGESYYGSATGLSPPPAGIDAATDPALGSTIVNGYTLYFAPGAAVGADPALVRPLRAEDVGPNDYAP